MSKWCRDRPSAPPVVLGGHGDRPIESVSVRSGPLASVFISQHGAPRHPTQDRHRAVTTPCLHSVVSSGFTHLDGQGNAVWSTSPARSPPGAGPWLAAPCAPEPPTCVRSSPAARPRGHRSRPVAGVQAAKATSDLIPLCTAPLGNVSIEVSVGDVRSRSPRSPRPSSGRGRDGGAHRVRGGGADRDGRVRERRLAARARGLALFEKTGGRSGTWRRG